jgi:hypothetical protein
VAAHGYCKRHNLLLELRKLPGQERQRAANHFSVSGWICEHTGKDMISRLEQRAGKPTHISVSETPNPEFQTSHAMCISTTATPLGMQDIRGTFWIYRLTGRQPPA